MTPDPTCPSCDPKRPDLDAWQRGEVAWTKLPDLIHYIRHQDAEIERITRERDAVLGKEIRVAAAVIEQDGLVRIFRRGGNDSYTGKWEFPGGKANYGESLQDALKRELHEELAVDSEVGEKLDHYWYRYPDRSPISLTFFAVKLLTAPEFLEHTESAWVRPEQLPQYDLMNGDMQFVATRYQQREQIERLKALLRDVSSYVAAFPELDSDNTAILRIERKTKAKIIASIDAALGSTTEENHAA
jgi:8-oxo-dGTP diphosphatase